MIFQLCAWHFDINWCEYEKRWADVFQIYRNAIHFNPLQFCPSMSLLGFPVFCLCSSIVLRLYFGILVNSMTIWSVPKMPKIAWPGPFNLNWKSALWEFKRLALKNFVLNVQSSFHQLIDQKRSIVWTKWEKQILSSKGTRRRHVFLFYSKLGS